MTDIHRLALAEKTARAAGEMLIGFHELAVEEKAAHDFVTNADRASEQFIRDALLSACPEDGFYGEESGTKTSAGNGRWIVDPIDGTTNFIKGLPIYTVSIAYEREGSLILGAVFCPVTGEMFTAQTGAGAYLNGKPIRVSGVNDPARAVCGMSFAHRDRPSARRMLSLLPRLTSELNDLRRLGSAAYDLCCVACGRYDAFIELVLNLYDIAAGVVIVREAGGVVTGWPGEDSCLITGNVLATNGHMRAWFEEALS